MFENTNKLVDETTKFIKGENKPVIVFEFSYENLLFIFIGLIIALVVTQLIVNALTKN
jgi:hypothetical protein